MKAMKAMNSSSFRNTLTYVARAARIANAVKKGDLSFVDKLPPRDWRQSDWNYEVDFLQYCLAYSNSEQYYSKDLLSLSRGREVTAENLEAEAAALQTRASALQTRVSILLKQAYEYQSKRYSEDASLLYEEAVYLEEEATRLLDMASDLREQAEYFKYEAEAVLEEDRYISKWEELYDLM